MIEFKGPFGSKGMGSLIKWIMSPEGSETNRKYFEQLKKDNSMTKMTELRPQTGDTFDINDKAYAWTGTGFHCLDMTGEEYRISLGHPTNKKCTCKNLPKPGISLNCKQCLETDKPTYTAGDEVTLRLTEVQACQMNKYKSFSFLSGEIIRHDPVKPITYKLSVFKGDDGNYHVVSCVGPRAKVIHELLVTYNPHTKEASIEVVS